MSGNLDRIQIVKGWVDAEGVAQERVYDVVWAGDRALDAEGRLPDVGNTVDVATASWTNTIGGRTDRRLAGSVLRPVVAFYYARIIEIPTPRGRLTRRFASGSTCRRTCR